MEDLFRFFVVRPPNKVEDEPVVLLDLDTVFVKDLRKAAADNDPARAVRQAARAKATAGDTDRLSELVLGPHLAKLDAALRSAAPPEDWTAVHVTAAVPGHLGRPIAEVVASEDFANDREAAQDGVLVIKIDSQEQRKDLAGLSFALSWFNLLQRIINDPAALAEPGSVARVLAAPLQLPEGFFPISEQRPVTVPPEKPEETKVGHQLAKNLKGLDELTAARNELMRIEPSGVKVDPVDQEAAGVAASRFGLFSRLFRGSDFAGRPALRFRRPAGVFALTDEARGGLSVGAQGVLEQLNIDAMSIALDRTVDLIEAEASLVRDSIAALEPLTKQNNVAKVGAMFFYVPKDVYPWHSPAQPGQGPQAVPDTHSSVEPVGVADLLIVRQELKCYEAREIAHIENILQGEYKSREHRRATTTEELVVTETETETEDEREHETTDRFEMQRETAETIKNDASVEAGLRVSGSYGMAVEFESHINGAMSQSRERSTRQASEHAREVSSRSASRVTERFKRTELRRLVREVEEKNAHKIDNRGGNGHVSGIYQWVEKTYEAQIWNYGLRTMYDFTVPEPAAFLIEALANEQPEGSLEKPTDFNLKPSQITENNYHY